MEFLSGSENVLIQLIGDGLKSHMDHVLNWTLIGTYEFNKIEWLVDDIDDERYLSVEYRLSVIDRTSRWSKTRSCNIEVCIDTEMRSIYNRAYIVSMIRLISRHILPILGVPKKTHHIYIDLFELDFGFRYVRSDTPKIGGDYRYRSSQSWDDVYSNLKYAHSMVLTMYPGILTRLVDKHKVIQARVINITAYVCEIHYITSYIVALPSGRSMSHGDNVIIHGTPSWNSDADLIKYIIHDTSRTVIETRALTKSGVMYSTNRVLHHNRMCGPW